MKSKDLNITDTTLIKQINNTIVEGNSLAGTGETREELKDSLKLKTGKVLRFYPESDTALVKLNTGNVRCLLTHMYLDSNSSVNVMPMGTMGFDKDYNEQYIKPATDVNVIVLGVEKSSTNVDYAILGYINNDNVSSSVDTGELRINIGDNNISIRNDSVSIESAYVYLNGMPLHLPKFDNIYEKIESDNITGNIKDSLEDVNSVLLSRISTLEERLDKLENGVSENSVNSISTYTSTGANTLIREKINILTNLKTTTNNTITKGEYIKTTITTKTNNPIPYETIQFEITRTQTQTSRIYEEKTNQDGTAQIQINLSPEQYTIKITHPETQEYEYLTTNEIPFTVQEE